MKKSIRVILLYLVFLPAAQICCYGQIENGFQLFRNALGGEYLTNFENEQANALRSDLINTIISYESVEAYGSISVGGGSSHQEVMVFCGDGTFRYSSLSSSNIGGGNLGGYSRENVDFQGVWDAFVQEGRMFIGLFSQDPWVLQYNSKGFIPLLVLDRQPTSLIIAAEGSRKIYRKSEYICQP